MYCKSQKVNNLLKINAVNLGMTYVNNKYLIPSLNANLNTNITTGMPPL